jgi:hypothetical protein
MDNFTPHVINENDKNKQLTTNATRINTFI